MPADCREQLVQLVIAGWTLRAAGRQFGLSQTSAWRIVAAKGDIPRRRRPRVPPATIRAINRLLASGYTQHRVAAELGISRDTVRRHDDSRPTGRCSKRRCPTCGALIVIKPCLACSSRSN